jgi:hypothetical protein
MSMGGMGMGDEGDLFWTDVSGCGLLMGKLATAEKTTN